MIKTSRIILGVVAVFSLQACNQEHKELSCIDAVPAVEQGNVFFSGLAQPFSAFNYSNNPVGISCHNCYVENSSDETLAVIDTAIKSGADIIELDVVISNAEQPIISHDITTSGTLFAEVVANPILKQADQILYIELKDDITSEASVRHLLTLLKQQQSSTGEYSYFNSTRFTVIRHADGYETLSNVRDVLAEAEFLAIQPFVKLSRIYFPNKSVDVEQLYQCGYHMVEFDYRIGAKDINSYLAQTTTLGLASNVFTLDNNNFELVLADIDNVYDSITVEAKLKASSIANKTTSLFTKVKAFITNN
ncbi:glycerophosphodiester phosphodiesterase family protein [Thalassotalea piscium]|uniref:GP-PDE domain-containing protein n=1 Tax=Thalassotalea piscium TaxID=1230533 RepID=A0A7X0NFY1_9GAMM|nr:glycerophosphodiester phosphodiesterase family protein [Thalassotalea piscium]MBB6542742.1 hypothetical protein [Thalassotalea piscium]